MSLESRVEKLEEYMISMAENVNRLSSEMRDFKEEMRDFKDEIKEEMKEFKDEMQKSKDDLNVKWGNLANQLGRVVEDLIIPNIDTLIRKYFEEDIEDYFGNLYKRKVDSNDGKEFDGIITTKSYIFLFEVKNQVTTEHAESFRSFIDSGEFFDYFKEYKGRSIVPVMGSINLKEHQVRFLTTCKILALAIKGDILMLMNFDALKDMIL